MTDVKWMGKQRLTARKRALMTKKHAVRIMWRFRFLIQQGGISISFQHIPIYNIRIHANRIHNLLKIPKRTFKGEKISGVHEYHPLATRHPGALVHRVIYTFVTFRNPPHVSRRERPEKIHGSIGRIPIHYDIFEIHASL